MQMTNKALSSLQKVRLHNCNTDLEIKMPSNQPIPDHKNKLWSSAHEQLSSSHISSRIFDRNKEEYKMMFKWT